MARLRRAEAAQPRAGIPAALADPAAAEWHDAELFAALVDRLNLDLIDPWPTCSPAAPCARRRINAVRAWAVGNGYTSTRWPGTLDHERLRLAGIGDLRTRADCPHENRPPKRRTRMLKPAKENHHG